MTHKVESIIRRIALVGAIFGAFGLGAAQTPQEGEVKSITYNINGHEVTRYFTATKTDDGFIRMIETDGPGGKAIHTTADWSKTDTGATRSRSTQYANGQTSSSETEWIMNSMGYTKVSSHTRRNGKTWNSTKDVTKTGNGGFTSSGTIVGPDGQTYTMTGSGHRTDTGYEKSKTITGPNGEQVVRTDNWTKTGKGSYERVTSTTGPKGGNSTRTRDVAKDGNTVNVNQRRQRTPPPNKTPNVQSGSAKAGAANAANRAKAMPQKSGSKRKGLGRIK